MKKNIGVLSVAVLCTLAMLISFAPNAFAALDDGLIANWRLNDCTATDSSGNGLHGSMNGNPLCTTGKVGKALYFDGIGDYFEVPHSPLFDIIETNQKLTIAAWIQIRGWWGTKYFTILDKV